MLAQAAQVERVVRSVDELRDELVQFTCELVRIPTVNPPGDNYRQCVEFLQDHYRRAGFATAQHVAEDSVAHSSAFPRINLLARTQGGRRPLVHINGHIDVVPPGDGWSREPFGAEVSQGRIYGRGSADMKAGIAAGFFAVLALQRAGVSLAGTVELSATVDEESGGQAGMAWLCERGFVHRSNTDFVIIPEPLNVDRVCVGHRGVYWFKITALGKIAHGSMPFLGENAIESLAHLIERMRSGLMPRLAERFTAVPVVPEAARSSDP